jgi:hypothetical protein
MTSKDLINRARCLYADRKENKKITLGVYRGTIRQVSGDAEDLFARYVKDALGGGFEVWVDPQLSCTPKRKSPFRPDICVVRDKTVVMLVELKMDLSRQKKTFLARAEKQAALLRELKSVRCSINGKDRECTLAAGLRWNFVLFSGTYLNAEQKQEIKARFAAKDAPGFLFILSGQVHPNDGVPELDRKAFDRFEKRISALKKDAARRKA